MQSSANSKVLDQVILEDISESIGIIRGASLEPIILITGSSGMIGSYLAEFYLGLSLSLGMNLEIILCARTFDANSERLNKLGSGKVKLLPIDKLSDFLNTNRLPVHIIHTASPAAVRNYVDDPMSLIETNLSLTLTLCEHLKNVGGHFTFMSSGEVYGHSAVIPTPENFEGAINHLEESFCYAESKRSAEFILKSYSTLNMFGVSIFRIYHAFGPGIRTSDSRIFATVINAVVEGSDVVLRSDGKSTRGFIYMGDVVRAILKTSQFKHFVLFNLCGSKEISVLEFAKLACEFSGGRSHIRLNTSGDVDSISNHQIKRGFADTSLIQSTGWIQKIDVGEGIARTIRSTLWRRSLI